MTEKNGVVEDGAARGRLQGKFFARQAACAAAEVTRPGRHVATRRNGLLTPVATPGRGAASLPYCSTETVVARRAAGRQIGFMRYPVVSVLRSLLVFTGCLAAALAADPGVIRIKAGVSAPLKDETGVVWQADAGFEGGDVVAREDNLAITNTKTPSLYRTERYSMTAFKWKLPNGKYTVKLHFAETFEGITAKGERVFSFNVEGKEFKDLDLFAKAGGANRAYIETVAVEIKDGQLDITFTPKVENPEINAIEIIPAK